MINEVKMRKCMKCKQEKPIHEFQYTPSRFFPAHRSLYCTSCLEIAIHQDDLDEVNKVCQWLDVPFDADKWTSLYEVHGEHTLSVYFNRLADEAYEEKTWREENERWKLAREEHTIDEEIAALSEAKVRKLKKTWSPAYTNEELLFLEEYYSQIVATQNVSTPILQHYARDLCEIELRIKKGLREGLDIKKDMDARDNIIKIAKFEASNAKNATDFESIGELMAYYEKKGWHPKWHQEPQDSIDFLMENMQNYLSRLVTNEGNFAEQVEDRRARYNLNERLDNIQNEAIELDETGDIEYEGEEDLVGDLSG